MIIAGALMFGRFLAVTRIPYDIADWVVTLPVPKTVIMLILFVIYIIGGMSKDVSLNEVFKGAAYFFPAYIVCILLLMLFPEIATFLPELIK